MRFMDFINFFVAIASIDRSHYVNVELSESVTSQQEA